jgi:GT2 family glycosyltransferase
VTLPELEQTTVSAVVCTHDSRRWEALVRAVESVRAQTRVPDELVVVVDGNDELLRRAREQLEGVVVVANEDEQGLSGARNTGVGSSHGSLVFFLDDDAAAEPDWVARLLDACRGDDILGAGGRVVPNWLGPQPGWFPDEFLWTVGCTYLGVPRERSRVRNVYGGCFCIRRAVVERAGGFTSELGRVGANRMGCEETELCIRAARTWPGAGFMYEPAAVIRHDVPADRLTWHYFRTRCFAEGMSKRRLSRLVGGDAALSSERAYTVRTLPAGVLRETGAAVRHASPLRLARAAAIVLGLAFTVAGYCREAAAARG